MNRLHPLLAALFLAAALPCANAWELAGTKTVTAITRDQVSIPIGTVGFIPQADGSHRVALNMDPARFTDHFLSMKEFKCLESPEEVACHVPYPYKNPGTVREGDYTWLEHQLLFLFKQPRDFGAKLWNGVYYRFNRDDQGLVGTPQAVDLNHISAPPDNLNVPPYGPAQRDDIPEGARWIARLLIR